MANHFILKHIDSRNTKHNDEIGQKYSYTSGVANHKKLTEGDYVLFRYVSGSTAYFLGHAIIKSISKKIIINEGKNIISFEAYFSNLIKFNPPKAITSQMQSMIKNQLKYNPQHSIKPISQNLFEIFVSDISTQNVFNNHNFKLLQRKKQIIFYGPPGTGKTYEAEQLSKNFSNLNGRKSITEKITFHQSYSYEEFIEGLKAKTDPNKHIIYEIEDGIFKKICDNASKDPNTDFILIIDEINRGNISKIFGELITILENNKRGNFDVTLPYSKTEHFTIPENLYIIGTMNTADRSIVKLDIALRRRFGFIEIMPKPDLLKVLPKISLPLLLTNLNKKILEHSKNRDLQIGHSFFMHDDFSITSISDLKFIFETEIIPLLQEYFYHNYDHLAAVLGNEFVDKDLQQIIEQETEDQFLQSLEHVLGNDSY